MSEGWIIFGVCVIFVFGAALPLVSNRNKTPLPPPKETLRDWRSKK